MAFEVEFTGHAVERFIQRHRPDLRYNQARRLLEDRAREATSLKQKTLAGDHQWQMADPDIVLVVKHERGRTVCVTILPEPEGYHGIPPEELEMMREYAERYGADQIKFYNDKIDGIAAKLQGPQASGPPVKPAHRQQLEAQMITAESKLRKLRIQLAREWIASQTGEAPLTTQNKKLKRQLRDANGRKGALTADLAKRTGELKVALVCLQHALRYLKGVEGDTDVDRVLGEVQRIAPSLLSKKFLGS